MPQQRSELPSDLASEARANGILLRSRLLAHERWLTSEQVAALMHTDADPEGYTRDLRSRGLLMGAEYRKQYWHPAFQFDAAGMLLPRLQELTALLPKSGNCWSAMFWMFQLTTDLDCRRPADVLEVDMAAVIAVARRDFVGDPDGW